MKKIKPFGYSLFVFVGISIFSCFKTNQLNSSDTPQFFSIQTEQESSLLTIFDSNKTAIQTIALDQNGPIGNPIKKLGLYSTTYHPMIEALNEIDKVVIIDTIKYSNNQKFIQRVAEKKILESGPFPGLDFETLLLSQADAIFIPPFSLTPIIKEKLKTANIRYYLFNEWQENTPLNKTAWIKVAAALLGKQELGEKIFNQLSNDYLRLKEEIATTPLKQRPLVLTSYPWQEQWGVCAKNSYLATLIYDAGGLAIPFEMRLKKHSLSATMLLSCETVLLHAHDAQIWLINSDPSLTKQSIAKQYPLLTELKAFKDGTIFNNCKRINSYGGNDYFEMGAFYPHLLLKDINKIICNYINGEKSDADSFVFYKQID